MRFASGTTRRIKHIFTANMIKQRKGSWRRCEKSEEEDVEVEREEEKKGRKGA